MTSQRREWSKDLDLEPDRLTTTGEADTTLLPEDDADSPPDSPTAVDDYGVTVAEEVRDEPLTQRLRREVRDVSPGHRPADPDLVAGVLAGRLVTEDGPRVAESGTVDLSAEEAAMHLIARQGQGGARPSTRADRLELLEAQLSVLLTMARIHTEALTTLAEALERLPTEEPGEAAGKVSRAARNAHDLLLSLRGAAG